MVKGDAPRDMSKERKKRVLSDKQKFAIKHVLNDPNVLVLADGTVWKRVGLPQQVTGNSIISVKVPPGQGLIGTERDYINVHLRDLVYAKFSGRLPEKYIVHKDNDPSNAAYVNLEESDSPYTYRKIRRLREQLTFDEEREVWSLYDAGVSKRVISRKLQTTVPVIEEVLSNGKRK